MSGVLSVPLVRQWTLWWHLGQALEDRAPDGRLRIPGAHFHLYVRGYVEDNAELLVVAVEVPDKKKEYSVELPRTKLRKHTELEAFATELLHIPCSVSGSEYTKSTAEACVLGAVQLANEYGSKPANALAL